MYVSAKKREENANEKQGEPSTLTACDLGEKKVIFAKRRFSWMSIQRVVGLFQARTSETKQSPEIASSSSSSSPSRLRSCWLLVRYISADLR